MSRDVGGVPSVSDDAVGGRGKEQAVSRYSQD